jgi:hypothetical protein
MSARTVLWLIPDSVFWYGVEGWVGLLYAQGHISKFEISMLLKPPRLSFFIKDFGT